MTGITAMTYENAKTSPGVLYVIAGGLYFHFRMSDEWYTASEGESESDEETGGIKRSWIRERFRAGAKDGLPRGNPTPAGGDNPLRVQPMRSLGRGLAPSNRPAQEIGDYKGGHFMRSSGWENPFKQAGIGRGGRGVSSEVMRHATASYSRLVSRLLWCLPRSLVQYEKRQWSRRWVSPKFWWYLPRSRWCSGGGQEAGKYALWPPLE